MNSPPPEQRAHQPDEDVIMTTPGGDGPITPTKGKPAPVRQLPTPYSPQNGGLVVTWDTNYGNIKRRLDFANDKPDTAAVAANVEAPSKLISDTTPAAGRKGYSVTQRDEHLARAKTWLNSATTPEQLRKRADAIVSAMFQGSGSYSLGGRARRADKDDGYCSWEDESLSDWNSEDEENLKNLAPRSSSSKKTSVPKHKLWNPAAVPADDADLPAPKIGEVGIQNDEDLDVITQFRETHNPVVASIRAGKVVLPYCGAVAPGGRQDQAQQTDEHSSVPAATVPSNAAGTTEISVPAVEAVSETEEDDDAQVDAQPGPQHRLTKIPPKTLPAGTKAAKHLQRQARRALTKKQRARKKNKKIDHGETEWQPGLDDIRRGRRGGAADDDGVPVRRQGSLRVQARQMEAASSRPRGGKGKGRGGRGGGGGKGRGGRGGKRATDAQRSMLVS
ncbi:uncharacterized protein B0I36DRAFT_1378 [Microdochium trichocladiopsis]|uniref:Uncharacterized protein n=1 Tax=Microdochium trichocladiopsis TaxID=1682393 RepID=A0A9P8YDB1_9PEZI|nr:uncharacterized protein B0I36DRAFT_1378 [Microdochium trichocladiopsis]KAH7039707.1 hypothetical protein B0I36DRAFT_1378 [Microdochium trichocladiopsis]